MYTLSRSSIGEKQSVRKKGSSERGGLKSLMQRAITGGSAHYHATNA